MHEDKNTEKLILKGLMLTGIGILISRGRTLDGMQCSTEARSLFFQRKLLIVLS